MLKLLNSSKDKLFENIFNYAKGGIAIVSPTGKWLKVNKSILNMLGYNENEIYGMTFQDITHKDDLDSDLVLFNQILNNEIESYQIEKRYFHKDGSVIWGHLNVSVFRDTSGEVGYFISQIMDITAEKDNALQRNLLAEVIQEKNEQLNDFAHIATHDLRTHVGNLWSITEFFEEENPEILINENFGMWKESLKNLNGTLQHLDTIRKEQHFQKKNIRVLKLNNFVNHAIYNVSSIARKYDVKIINTLDREIEVMAIEAYLDSIFLNFLTNAIKYRSDNRLPFVKITSKMVDDFIVVDILDNGIGIDLDKNRNKLFSLNSTFSDREDARGIGLFISKNHIESIGGKVEVTSELGVGSCFSIYFRKVN